MKHKTRTKALSWLLSLALMLSLVPGMGLTAYAADNVTTGASFDGIVEGDTLSVSATGSFDTANVGEGKTVTISNSTLDGADKDNYVLAEEGQQTSTTAKITAKAVGLNWTNTELTYTGEAQKPTATATGLIEGDECTVTVSGEQTNAGDNPAGTAASPSERERPEGRKVLSGRRASPAHSSPGVPPNRTKNCPSSGLK